jgi:hypothetical protein
LEFNAKAENVVLVGVVERSPKFLRLALAGELPA